MKLNIKSKKFIAAALAVVAVVGAGSATARFSHETEWTFYDDNGNVVGGRLLACNGRVFTYGVTSSNYDVVRDVCH